MVDEKTDVVENEVIVKRFADIAEFDEVACRGRLYLRRNSRAHAGLLLLMSLPAEANQILSRIGFSLSSFDFCQNSKDQNQTG